MKKKNTIILLVFILITILLCGCEQTLNDFVSTVKKADSDTEQYNYNKDYSVTATDSTSIGSNTLNLSDIPEFTDEPFVEINNNKPFFTDSDLTTTSYEQYAELDNLGRCGCCEACIGKDIMPTEERGPIGMVKPSGWQLVKYDFIDGKYLYNRCHLIGFQLAGENANEKNLITGTRYLNVTGMLPFENEVADYVESTRNHVMYRVTPIFENDNLLANGVLMEAYSVEDSGEGVCFNVYCYNAQPNVEIDYKTGNNKEITD